MTSSLSNLVDNLAEGIYKIKYKYGHENKKCELCEIKQKDCDCHLEKTHIKDDLIVYKCLHCDKNYESTFDET